MQVGKYVLDKSQEKIVKDESNYLLVTAGAGSGKTLTILGKLNYLVIEKKIREEEILCISFTNAATKSLEDKIKSTLNLTIPTYTFHKLALEILKINNMEYDIADSTLLEDITKEFFEVDIFSSVYHLTTICQFYKKRGKSKEKVYRQLQKTNNQELYQLERLIMTFIRLMKCNAFELKDFIIFSKKIKKTFSYKQYKREKTILIFALNIYLKYQKYLEENKEIDFDDMLRHATKQVKRYIQKRKIKYIIIAEYQDTSYIRFSLIKEIIKYSNAKLMVVGDDFQSIYRFTGCDISLFLDFSSYFKKANILKIEKTYRNSQELIKIAGIFVMANKNQIRKKLTSSKSLTNPIEIIYYQNIKTEFLKIIANLSKNKEQKIFILGRNNFDINLLLNENIKAINNKIKIKDYEYLDIMYMTIHKSKGLESDNVILINMENKLTGFPNQIQDDKITRLLIKTKDTYPYSEERRLFYVALTRTKNKVYVLVPKRNPSIFIKELEDIIKTSRKKSTS